jgi:hypothetical protein
MSKTLRHKMERTIIHLIRYLHFASRQTLSDHSKKKTCLEARASRGFLLKCVFDLLHPVPPSAVGIHADVIVVLSRLKEQETFVPILPFPYLGLVTGRGPRAVSGPFSALF